MNTPKNFALQLGALITLYVSLTSLMVLLFSAITLAIPDAADSVWEAERASESIRFSIAMIVVFFPVYLWLTRTVNQIRRQEEGMYLTLTRWLIYLSLLAGGAVLLGDLVAVIYGWLNGDLTLRFLLKAAVLGLAIGAAFYYYARDARGHWQENERTSLWFGAVVTVFVLASLIFAFQYTETPTEVREAALDEQQVADLQELQWRIEEYFRGTEMLPTDLSAIYGENTPVAPDERPAYRYEQLGENAFQLCATFATDSIDDEYARSYPYPEKNYNWNHTAGEHCFDRSVEKPSF